MKQYYAERNGLIADKLSLSLNELKTYEVEKMVDKKALEKVYK